MSNIIEFPSKLARDWAVIERLIRDVLCKAAIPPESQEEVLARMKDFTGLLQLNFTLTLASTDQLALKAQYDLLFVALQELSQRLIAERLEREMDFLILSGRL